jgi:hypothetical protein
MEMIRKTLLRSLPLIFVLLIITCPLVKAVTLILGDNFDDADVSGTGQRSMANGQLLPVGSG